MSLKWHSGPPPHIGWWNASTTRQPDIWRWWDGTQWSKPAHRTEPARWADTLAATPATEWDQQFVEWTRQWPKGARVPRINPEIKR